MLKWHARHHGLMLHKMAVGVSGKLSSFVVNQFISWAYILAPLSGGSSLTRARNRNGNVSYAIYIKSSIFGSAGDRKRSRKWVSLT